MCKKNWLYSEEDGFERIRVTNVCILNMYMNSRESCPIFLKRSILIFSMHVEFYNCFYTDCFL